MSVIIFLIILAVLILVHEFGHFIVAKKSGIRVDEFGLGFPPKIFSKKFGSTLYTLNLLPFGGFVKIFGEDPVGDEDTLRALAVSNGTSPDQLKSQSFQYKPKWIQSLVLIAGVTMNIIFAWLVISLGFSIGLPAGVDYSGFGKVSNIHLVVTEVLQDSPAQIAGLHSGDIILSVVSGDTILKDSDVTPENVRKLIGSMDRRIDITYTRGNSLPVTASMQPSTTITPGERIVGIGMDEIGTLKLPIHLALLEGARTTGLLIKETAIGLARFFYDAVRFKSDLSQVSGPIGIASVVGEATHLGFVYLLSLVALISINLAIINLLPFPALDGGRLFFIIIEVVTRRKIPASFVRWSNVIGFALLLILMVVITGHDILKLL